MFETGKRRFISETFGIIAELEALEMRPYKGAEKVIAYRLCCYAEYDDGLLYHCNCYATYEEAYNHMWEICDNWKEE